ncbi:hypothetical protein FA95DRAFT_1310191 [Auriscalpium vulgare]|uniref:Uncharacterized protein n=1 Tax=Auriscalpium vulgare TaxID=40419 RepID=A0ACB8RSE9_9AGAM|nr:hypothetical protein FA95DRAFT_1310191 [Auriscalpium vulgare]
MSKPSRDRSSVHDVASRRSRSSSMSIPRTLAKRVTELQILLTLRTPRSGASGPSLPCAGPHYHAVTRRPCRCSCICVHLVNLDVSKHDKLFQSRLFTATLKLALILWHGIRGNSSIPRGFNLVRLTTANVLVLAPSILSGGRATSGSWSASLCQAGFLLRERYASLGAYDPLFTSLFPQPCPTSVSCFGHGEKFRPPIYLEHVEDFESRIHCGYSFWALELTLR